MGRDEQLDVMDLVDGEDLDFLRKFAAERGLSLGEVGKDAIQKVITDRTRPRKMRGNVQAFQRR